MDYLKKEVEKKRAKINSSRINDKEKRYTTSEINRYESVIEGRNLRDFEADRTICDIVPDDFFNEISGNFF